MRDSDGGAAKADEGQYHDEGRCDTLLVHHRRSVLSSPHEARHCVRRGLRQPLHGGSREDHWAAVKRLLCYVKGTVDQVIIFPKAGGSRL